MTSDKGMVQDLLKHLTPEQQAFAQDYAKIRAEHKMLQAALSQSERRYAHLYAFLLAILRQMDGFEIRFKRKDFEAYQMFKEAWEMQSEYEEETDEQILRLMYRGGGPDVGPSSGEPVSGV